MHQQKRLDSCIKMLQTIVADPTNELELAQQRTIARNIRKLKKLKKQPRLTRDEVYNAVSEVSETILEIM